MKKIALVISNVHYVNNAYDNMLYAAYAADEMPWTDFCPSTDVYWMEYVRDVLFSNDVDTTIDVYLDMSYGMSIPTAMGIMAAAERWRTIIGRLMVLDGNHLMDMTCLIK